MLGAFVVESEALPLVADLDQAAAEAVRRWRFDPARRGQTPIDGWVTVPLNFKLS